MESHCKNKRVEKFFILTLIIGGLLLAGCAILNNKPKSVDISLSEYIEAVEEPATDTKPFFNHTLRIDEPVMTRRAKGYFKPDKAFDGKFISELREGAVVFFKLKGRFKNISKQTGNLGLSIDITNYEGGAGKPERVSLKALIKLYHVPTETVLLSGVVESFLENKTGKLTKPVTMTLKEKEYVVKLGTVRMAEVSHHLFRVMDAKLADNEKIIFRKLEGLCK